MTSSRNQDENCYCSEKRSDYDEIWNTESDTDYMIKNDFPNSQMFRLKMADGRHIGRREYKTP